MTKIISIPTVVCSCLFFISASPVQAQDEDWPEYKRGNTQAPTAIKAVQLLLNGHGQKIVVDGRFGVATENAVKRFQAVQKLQITGKMSRSTWQHLTTKIRKGSRGSIVRALQLQLTTLGYSRENDGYFGEKTRLATMAFQKRYTLKADGIAGRKTWNRLIMEVALYYE